jgi:hypothetical protein
MAKAPDSYLGTCGLLSFHCEGEGKGRYRNRDTHWILRLLTALLTAALLLAPFIFAQGTPRVTGVEPSSGKVNDNVTLTVENLGKDSVSAVILSDGKTDHDATVVEQADQKIVFKVPIKEGDHEQQTTPAFEAYMQGVHRGGPGST